jgi:hypothetical protein
MVDVTLTDNLFAPCSSWQQIITVNLAKPLKNASGDSRKPIWQSEVSTGRTKVSVSDSIAHVSSDLQQEWIQEYGSGEGQGETAMNEQDSSTQ